jgi:hypothetical protein
MKWHWSGTILGFGGLGLKLGRSVADAAIFRIFHYALLLSSPRFEMTQITNRFPELFTRRIAGQGPKTVGFRRKQALRRDRVDGRPLFTER